eukprot:CAMPEP_0202908702 /NCGR_PEP_ID=MMETSP1392-20130828/46949_1 /ASSEMBLY_ACC=CAM_ASM_000868 /TAXON_ID=225041 /ORGANISM="Chlamydomonas chlamydogama, Strain SAG 11-48b" /LENGTH=248 /DNA_ID=CAMNT_0049598161 /DNA_START=1 /DNA_END=743 /DNA_ORIENTATION=+
MVHTGFEDAVRRTLCTAGPYAALGAAALLLLNPIDANEAPELVIADGPLKRCVLPHCKALREPYRPTPWAANKHANTLLGPLRALAIPGRYSRQLIITLDGGTIGLDWWMGCDHHSYSPPDMPVLLVIHGINGGSHEGYVKWACAAAASKGWRAVAMCNRGCNGVPLTAPRGYSATNTHDLHRVIQSIKGRFPSAPIFAAGYSMGGISLTKYLAEADSGLFDVAHTSSTPALSTTRAPSFSGSGLVAA